METTQGCNLHQPSPGAAGDLTHAERALRLVREMEHQLQQRGDLLELQIHCEMLASLLAPDQIGRELAEWVATQAELIDCKLIGGGTQSIDVALRELLFRIKESQQSC